MSEKYNVNDMLYEEPISSEEIFSGRIMRIVKDTVELPNGHTATREVMKKSGGVCVVALTDDEKVVMVNQFRYPYGEVVKEVPAGKMEKGEDPLVCGLRELSEETGYQAGEVKFLGEFYPSPGIMDEVLYMYLATDLKQGEIHTDEDEFLTVELIPLRDAVNMAVDGNLPDGKTQAAILKTWFLKQNGVI